MLKTVKNGSGIRVDHPPCFFKIPTFSRFFFADVPNHFVGFVAGVDCGPYRVVLIFICVIVIVRCQCAAAVRSNLFAEFGGGLIGNFGKEWCQSES